MREVMKQHKFIHKEYMTDRNFIFSNRFKIFFFLFFISISFSLFSQNYDVRKTKWGMSVKEVKKSEKPLEGEISTSGRL